MAILDLTGPIQAGMWHYEPPFPSFGMRPLGDVPWAGSTVYCDVFDGFNSQTGTYLETPAHVLGPALSYMVDDIPVASLYEMKCHVLQLAGRPEFWQADSDARQPGPDHRCPGPVTVTASMLEACAGAAAISPGSALLVGTGWGRHWLDACYLDDSPCFSLDAMAWLIAKKPFLLGSDFPRWESQRNPAGIFPLFYARNILMLAPCVNLERAGSKAARLTVLPLRIPGTCCVPCRAVLVEDS